MDIDNILGMIGMMMTTPPEEQLRNAEAAEKSLPTILPSAATLREAVETSDIGTRHGGRLLNVPDAWLDMPCRPVSWSEAKLIDGGAVAEVALMVQQRMDALTPLGLYELGDKHMCFLGGCGCGKHVFAIDIMDVLGSVKGLFKVADESHPIDEEATQDIVEDEIEDEDVVLDDLAQDAMDGEPDHVGTAGGLTPVQLQEKMKTS